MKIPGWLYELLKWLCVIFLPALSTTYSALAGIWGLPYAEQIPATITAISLFLGAIIGVSSVAYSRIQSGGEQNLERSDAA